TVEQSDNLETKTRILQDQNGNKTALLKTQIEPTVKGVVIVCEGGANATVESDVTQAVMTALDIKSNKVCVVKKSK
ncbi:MAG: stage III sporulation protein AG, partial [Oscillospiraceae bacterium]